jgi:hypothetical protein
MQTAEKGAEKTEGEEASHALMFTLACNHVQTCMWKPMRSKKQKRIPTCPCGVIGELREREGGRCGGEDFHTTMHAQAVHTERLKQAVHTERNVSGQN